jgi:cation-transporting ATPase E
MCVADTVALGNYTEDEIRAVIARIEGAEASLNATSRALVDAFGTDTSVAVVDKIPFSSERKHSAVAFADGKVYSIGAPHFVPCAVDAVMEERIDAFAEEGKRVLVIAEHPALGEEGCAIAMVAIADRIRPNAKEVIANFQSQGVTVKIISGDHAHTVSSIAKRVGVKDAEKYLSCENISPEELEKCAEEYAVFGRVTPEQKVLLVKKLRSLGHTVAMTGDGVNDTLALKESNCAIAMADGSEMARKVSQIVLLDSDFATLPDVVREGRRCINNVRMSASLFLMKTILTIFLSIYAVCTVSLYPFTPSSMLIIEFAIIGIASVLLALEPNNKRIEGSFIKTVILRAIPSAVGMIIPVMVLLLIERFVGFSTDLSASLAICNALAMLAMTAAGYVNLVMICFPYTKWRIGVVLSMGVLSLAVFFGATFLLGDMLKVSCLAGMGGAIALSLVGAMACAFISQLVAMLIKKWRKMRAARVSVE